MSSESRASTTTPLDPQFNGPGDDASCPSTGLGPNGFLMPTGSNSLESELGALEPFMHGLDGTGDPMTNLQPGHNLFTQLSNGMGTIHFPGAAMGYPAQPSSGMSGVFGLGMPQPGFQASLNSGSSMHAAMSLSASEVSQLQLLIAQWSHLRERVDSAFSTATAACEQATEANRKVLDIEEWRSERASERESSIGPIRTEPEEKTRAARKVALEDTVHQKMISMLGIRYVGKRGVYDLPEPPPAPQVPPEDEASVWTPEWTKKLKYSPYNRAFLARVDTLLTDMEQHIPEEKRVYLAASVKSRQGAIKTYFGTLAKAFCRGRDPSLQAKYEESIEDHREFRRRERQSQDLLSAAKRVEEDIAHHLGRPVGEVCGIAALIQVQWLDELHSDCGAVDLAEWDARKREAGGGVQQAWEARRLRWKSMFLRKILLLLLKKVHEDQKGKAAHGSTFIFPGLHANTIDTAPPSDKLPWRRCVSQAWITRNQADWAFKDDDVDKVPILAVDIPDDLFTDEDRLWLEEDKLDTSAGDSDDVTGNQVE
ncbi:hypothetical protein FOMPIDRAFT_93854 [Fomitopsis schrenkii]|uniref:Uncharacterized protein n=1 Tax=Fomitopsis schrenkii TaxID=2126942 RepID=S8DVA4_FOMSC|nr:hypothetical protein FOMPIDRAFT_93854 [Fomitopsis schrenkii]